jgi:hypothetical protein
MQKRINMKTQEMIVTHVDGVTKVKAKGQIINGEFIGEYRLDKMTWGVVLPVVPKRTCRYCENAINDDYESENTELLCKECDNKYDNKTGHCSLYCCVGGECDGAC